MHMLRIINANLFLFLTLLCHINIAAADEQIYVREYIYQASEADSKLSARAIALQEVKRELLSELGTHVSSVVKLNASSDGTKLGTEEIETLSAGVTRVEILNEKWDGVTYVLKAQIKADPSDVLKSLEKMLDADKKQKQVSRLEGDVTKLRLQNINVSESLTQAKKETEAALAEIARLKHQLEKNNTDVSRQTLQAEYKDQIDIVTLITWYLEATDYSQKEDYPSAIRLFKKAAEHGHANSQLSLGLIYYNGKGVARDAKQAMYWFLKAAEQGSAIAQAMLGGMYGEGDTGIDVNENQAVYWYQKAATQGIAFAQSNLGVMYNNGMGVSKDTKQGMIWLHKAADQGNSVAQYNLAKHYSEGVVVPRDEKQSMFWLQKAADQGDIQSQFNLGGMYLNGKGVTKNFQQAMYWFQKAANQGYAKAQFLLGLMNEGALNTNDNSVALDVKQAMYWYQKAAEQGHIEAQFLLGNQYGNNPDVFDLKQSAYWYQKAAEYGHVDSQYELGMCYFLGKGVATDVKKAEYWLKKAELGGQDKAKNMVQMLFR